MLLKLANRSKSLPGGLRNGDTVYFVGINVSFPSGNRLIYGLQGKIVAGKDISALGEKVKVRFPGNKDDVNVFAASLSTTAPPALPNGWKGGDIAYFMGSSQTFPSGDKLTHGSAGEVVGPKDNAVAGDKVLVRFSWNTDDINIGTNLLAREAPPPLPEGWTPGDKVWFIGQMEAGTKVQYGLEGEVIAPIDKATQLKGDAVKVRFRGRMRGVDVKCSMLARTPPSEDQMERSRLDARILGTFANSSDTAATRATRLKPGILTLGDCSEPLGGLAEDAEMPPEDFNHELLDDATPKSYGNHDTMSEVESAAALYKGGGSSEYGFSPHANADGSSTVTPLYKGRSDISETPSSLPPLMMELPGGWKPGEVAYFTGLNRTLPCGNMIKYSQEGEVVAGPKFGIQDGERVRVRFFGNDTCSAVSPAMLSPVPPPALPGGWLPGDRVYFTGLSVVSPCGDDLVSGQEGEVVGPRRPYDGQRVMVRFVGCTKLKGIATNLLANAPPADVSDGDSVIGEFVSVPRKPNQWLLWCGGWGCSECRSQGCESCHKPTEYVNFEANSS